MSTNTRRDLDETAPNPPVPAPGAAAGPGDGRQLPVPAAYTFLNVTLDMRRQLVIRGNDEIRLRPRAFDVLRYLVTNAGRLISKQELIDAVWADVAVTDDSLVQCLIEIRRGLGGAEDHIKTVRGRGYLLDCEVRPSAAPDSNIREEEPRSVEVADIGIPAAELPQLGRRFYRADKARARAQGGHGLGLAIAQSLIHAHGGELWLESEEGTGTTASFTLPTQ